MRTTGTAVRGQIVAIKWPILGRFEINGSLRR